jgi:prepilin-type N-terminal cleavage/methylation domain-containing protein
MGLYLKKVFGFTMVELVLTLAVLGALVGVAYVAIDNSIASFRLDAASAKLVNDIRFAKHLARTRNGWFGVSVQTNPINQYIVYETDGGADVAVPDPVNPAHTLVIKMDDEYAGTTITAANIDGGTKVEFNALGVPYTDMLLVPITAAGTITLTQGDISKTIQILPETGRVEEQ